MRRQLPARMYIGLIAVAHFEQRIARSDLFLLWAGSREEALAKLEEVALEAIMRRTGCDPYMTLKLVSEHLGYDVACRAFELDDLPDLVLFEEPEAFQPDAFRLGDQLLPALGGAGTAEPALGRPNAKI